MEASKKKYVVSVSNVQKTKLRQGLKTNKTFKIPKISEKQIKIIKTRARKLYDNFLSKSVMTDYDDETYVKAYFATLPKPSLYIKSQRETLLPSEKQLLARNLARNISFDKQLVVTVTAVTLSWQKGQSTV